MEAVSNLVNNVSNLVANVSNFSQPFDENREERASVVIGGNEAMLIEFNAALLADFRHVERTLFALQRNLDDFYFVTLTAITFGRIFVFTVWLSLRLLLLVICYLSRVLHEAMQCGFAFMEVGLVRTKNTTNILLKGTIDACKFWHLFLDECNFVKERFISDIFSVVGCLSYWLFGYAIAWSQGNSFVGWHHWAFANLPPEK